MPKPPKAVLAPRPAPDPAAIEAFISGKPLPAAEVAPPPPAPAPRIAPPPPPPPAPIALGPASPAPKRTVIRRKDGRELYRTTIYLEPELAQRTGIFAVKQGVDQTEIIKAALTEYLARHGG